jgi:HEAT repeat protein
MRNYYVAETIKTDLKVRATLSIVGRRHAFSSRFFVAALFSMTIFLVFCSPGFSQEKSGGDSLKSAKSLMLEGKYQESRKILENLTGVGEEAKIEKEKALAWLSVIDYQEPDWYPDDLSGLKKYKKIALPLMLELADKPAPKNSTASQKKWITQVRSRFFNALGKMKYTEAAPAMIRALKEKDVRIRLSVINALGELKTRDAVRPLYEYLKTEFIPDFKTKEDLARESRLGEAAKIGALSAIVNIGDTSLLDELQKEIGRKGSPDRQTAAMLLTGFRLHSLKKTYIDMLSDSDDTLKIYAASALKDLGNDQGLPVLKKIFEAGDARKKLWVFRVMSGWRDRAAAEYYLEYLSKLSEGRKFGYVSLSSLGKVPALSRTADPETLLHLEIIQTLISWKDFTAPLLIERIKNEKGNLRYIMTEVLGEIGEAGDPRACSVFRSSLDSGDPLMKYYAIWALGRLDDRDSIQKIKKFLSGGEVNLKAAAAWSLARMDDSSGYNEAIGLLNSKESYLAGTALDTLYYLRKKESGEKICQMLERGFADPSISREAIILLGILGDSSSTALLKKLAQNPGVESYLAAEALYRINGEKSKFGLVYTYPDDFSMYGDGNYGDLDYARVILLYLMINPAKFGQITDLDAAYSIPLPIFGEFGEITTNQNTNPAHEKPDLKTRAAWDLSVDRPLLVSGYEGRMAEIIGIAGSTGWVSSAGLNVIKNSSEATRSRIRADYGYRWRADLLKILENDYLPGAQFQLSHKNPATASQVMTAIFLLEASAAISGRPQSGISWKPITELIDKSGERTISVRLLSPRKTFDFKFDWEGKLRKMEVRE